MCGKFSGCCHLAAIFFIILVTGQVGLYVGAEGQGSVGLWKGVCELVGDDVLEDAGTRSRRSKRSLKGAEQENPDALFKYLFPLVASAEEEKTQETQGRRGRHMDFDNDLTAWIQDALELVRQECQETLNPLKKGKNPKKKKAGRGIIRRQGNWRNEEFVNKSASNPPLTPWNLPEGYNFRWGSDAFGRSAAANSSSLGHGEEENDDEQDETQVEDEDSELLDELANFEHGDDEDYEEDLRTSTGASEADTTEAPPATTAAPTDTTTPFNPGDVHFASYGGDVEYWFPMISWGIPFDGEITVYNFHGFDGMGTY